MRILSVVLGTVTLSISIFAAPVMTRFDPNIHGFKFSNRFVDDEIDAFDTRRAGFCAGVAYNALDYFKSGKVVPKQWWLPARGTPLERQILDRHKTANFRNADRWAELELNPGGERDTEFYEWGISSRIPELRASIDRGEPIPIGLRGDGSGHHEVLAIGYDMGSYRGDKRGAVRDFTIFVYDPNYPGQITQIKPDPSRKVFVYTAPFEAATSGIRYRTWFCDTKYSYKAPGNMPPYDFLSDGKVGGLLFSFDVGEDDLRGGKDGGNSYIDLKVTTNTGSVVTYPGASLGQRWLSNVNQTVFFQMRQKPNIGLIRSVEVIHRTEGGISPDNWTMKSLTVHEVGKTVGGEVFANSIFSHGQHRFDGKARTLSLTASAPVSVDKTRTIVCAFRTDGDDLRGTNDNVSVTVNFADGSRQRFENVNQRVQWPNDSINTVRLDLTTAVKPEDIVSIDLDTSNRGIVGQDNWTMGMFTAGYVQGGAEKELAVWGQHRFTRASTLVNVPCQTRFEANKSRLLHVIFGTGGDDLRGGNDNLKIKVVYKSGRTEVFPYVNQGVQWNNNKRSDVTLLLASPVSNDEVASVELEVDRGGDNWSMESVEVWLRLKTTHKRICSHGQYRFSGESSKLVIRP